MDVDFACQNDGCLSAMLWKGAAVETHPPGYTLHPITASAGVGRRLPRPAGEAPVASAGTSHECPAQGACPVNANDIRSERDKLIEVMETAGWVQAKAARIMGLTPRQVGYALRKLGIELKKF